MASSSLFFGVLFAIISLSSADGGGINKPSVRIGDTFRTEWSEEGGYKGYLPSIRTSFGSKNGIPGFEMTPVTYPGPTSQLVVEIDGHIFGPDELAGSFVGQWSLFDFFGQDVDKNLTGSVQLYNLLIASGNKREENDNSPIVEIAVISESVDVGTGNPGDNYIQVTAVTYLRDSNAEPYFPGGDIGTTNDTYPVAEGPFYEIEELIEDNTFQKRDEEESVAGTKQKQYHGFSSIKVRYLIDLDLEGDDGVVAYPYDQRTIWTSDQEITSDDADPAIFFISERYAFEIAENTEVGKRSERPNPHLLVGFDTKGPRTGADRLFLASYEYARWTEYSEYQGQYNNNEEPFYYRGLPFEGDEFVGDGDVSASHLLDDSAFLIYFDGSSCWGEGYPLIKEKPMQFTVKLFAKFVEYDSETAFAGPTRQQCPYCWPDDIIYVNGEEPDNRGKRDITNPDEDEDGIFDFLDRCPSGPVVDFTKRCDAIQFDIDLDWIPDACDYCPVQFDEECNQDVDGDGLGDNCDNCPQDANPSQVDNDEDTYGNACDNCVNTANDQEDADQDTVGDACDNCVNTCNTDQSDIDMDGVGDNCDNCVEEANADQTDVDMDQVGDICDNCPDVFNEAQDDWDQDGRGDFCDNCVEAANYDQADADMDLVGDICDNCPVNMNTDQADDDLDGFGDVCDLCRNFYSLNNEDQDKDLVGDVCDNCVAEANFDQADGDTDLVGDACDNCVAVPNPDQANDDSDAWGDVCDNCPSVYQENQADYDADTLGDACDNCVIFENTDQANRDGDSIGDVCDWCPDIKSENNTDSDGDLVGDLCDWYPHSFYPEFTYPKYPINGPDGVFEVTNKQIHPGYFVSDYANKIVNGAEIQPPKRQLNTHQQQEL